MAKYFILVTVFCKDGVTITETSLFNDLTVANIHYCESLKYYIETAPADLEIYDGHDSKRINWFEVGEMNNNFWVRCELQGKDCL